MRNFLGVNCKEAFYFVGRCLGLREDNRATVRKQIEQHQVEWEKVVWVASNHLVFPALYLKFCQNRLLQFVPGGLAAYLEDVYRLNEERNNNILRQVKELNTLLLQNNISPVFMKGTACLLDGLYAGTGERMIGDIDLLAGDDDFFRAIDVLKSYGYSNKIPFRSGDISFTKHYPRLVKEGGIAAVEVHRQPVCTAYTKYFNFNLVDSCKTISKGLGAVFVPSDTHKVIQNFIHGQLNDKAQFYGTVSLRNCYDLHLLEKRGNARLEGIPVPLIKRFNAYHAVKSTVFAEQVQVSGFYSKVYCCRLNLNLRYHRWAKSNVVLLYLSGRVANYMILIYKAFFIKEIRQSLFYRLKEWNWYRLHFASFKLGLKRFY
ncbi:hypothetical protein MNBD_BACTEROID01-1826 [hydrothermal vent metagenome]|uniref:Nucleotidyltransferase family protein n=1 Tax=hydrothermal vent metagenome TaxID=652676 RepID=A0A3B0UJN7_9ZZZZ